MDPITQTISNIGIVPVIAIEDAEKAVPLAQALSAGGLPAAEITFRTAAGEEAIRQVARNCPQVLVGAGTILNVEQCDRALAAGAQFIVSPGYDEALVRRCTAEGVPVFPGCASASDMLRAVNAGLEVVKFFPAELSGGVAFLKSLAPVFPLRFLPTGGVSAKNLMDYLSFHRVAACGGTWMVKKDLIQGERWEEITALCREAVRTMLGFSLAHVGIHCESPAEAERTANTLCALFGFECAPGTSSVFAGSAVECMKAPRPGKNGHIAIATHHLDRAVYHLSRQGAVFDESTRTGKVIYLKEPIGGFAIHLMQR